MYFRSQKMTYKTIPESIGFSHDTIWRLVKKYGQEGLSLLIQDTRGDRYRSYLTYEEERSFLQEQFTSPQDNLSQLQSFMKPIKSMWENRQHAKVSMPY